MTLIPPSPGLWPPGQDVRIGDRIAWENDSAILTNNTSVNVLAAYTIPAGVKALGGPGGFRWDFHCHFLITNTGTDQTHTIRVRVNGTNQIGTSTYTVTGGVGERLAHVDWCLLGDNDYGLNQWAKFRVSGLMSPPQTTDDLMNRTGYTRGNSFTSPSWDSPLLLEITSQWTALGSGQQVEFHGYDVQFWATTPG